MKGHFFYWFIVACGLFIVTVKPFKEKKKIHERRQQQQQLLMVT